MELYKKYRPKNFKDVVGQSAAVKQLVGMKNSIPHTLLFTGGSGTGKTTLARILASKLKCSAADLYELNAANSRGIDMVRDIEAKVGISPMDGPVRVWIIDESHQLTSPAQDAFLKVLEDTPNHAYFFLATTDPQKLKKTIVTRCTEIKLSSIDDKTIVKLVLSVADAEGSRLSANDGVAEKIAEIADGSARKALVLLHQIINIKDQEDQLAALEKADTKRQAIEICRILMRSKPKWVEIAKIIKNLDEEPETIRHLVLAYMTTVALGGGNNAGKAIEIIECFQDNYFDSKKAGLVKSCFLAAST